MNTGTLTECCSQLGDGWETGLWRVSDIIPERGPMRPKIKEGVSLMCVIALRMLKLRDLESPKSGRGTGGGRGKCNEKQRRQSGDLSKRQRGSECWALRR